MRGAFFLFTLLYGAGNSKAIEICQWFGEQRMEWSKDYHIYGSETGVTVLIYSEKKALEFKLVWSDHFDPAKPERRIVFGLNEESPAQGRASSSLIS